MTRMKAEVANNTSDSAAMTLPEFDPRPLPRGWLVFWAIIITLAYLLPWGRQWYPLSDSSLYLSLGRSLADGRGLTMMGDPVRLTPPGTPILIAGLVKLGAGIGLIQAVLIGLMLVSHALCYLTLARWTTPRIALGATVACALSYWVFANAFTIMSEPLCVALLWGGCLALSHVTPTGKHRWTLVVLASLLLLLAAANRDAVLCLLPGPVLAMLLHTRVNGKFTRQTVAWAAVFTIVFGSWFVYRYPPKFLVRMFTPKARLTTQPTAPAQLPAINPEFEVEPDGVVREGRYKSMWLYGVDRTPGQLLTKPWVLGGRWVSEGLVMASVAVFESKNVVTQVVATTVAVLALALTLAGLARLLRHEHWWVIGPFLYFSFIWLQWGIRIKPRYMIPIAPLLAIMLWCGTTWAIGRLLRWLKGSGANDAPQIGRWVMNALAAAVVLGNVFPWAVETYIRRASDRDFYDVARRGAYAQLVDIGAYLQKHVPDNQSVWMNAGAHRRIAYFLGGRKIETLELPIRDWRDFELLVDENRQAATPPSTRPASRPATRSAATTRPATAPATRPTTALATATTEPAASQPVKKRGLTLSQRRKRFFRTIDPQARYLIVFVDEPAGRKWPGWHLPMRAGDTQVEWWRLYERQADDSWKRVAVPRQRDYVQAIPRAAQ